MIEEMNSARRRLGLGCENACVSDENEPPQSAISTHAPSMMGSARVAIMCARGLSDGVDVRRAGPCVCAGAVDRQSG
jgi:hypothetical protein